MSSVDSHAEAIFLRRQPVDVGVLVELTTEIMQIQAKALGVALRIRIDDDVPAVVNFDRDKVGWSITSLVGSALRHVRRVGGVVELHVGYSADPPVVRFSVRDNGPGIPPAQLARLLQRENWHPGSALALLLVEDIAVAHGGAVMVESKGDRDNHFTQVTFTIPIRFA